MCSRRVVHSVSTDNTNAAHASNTPLQRCEKHPPFTLSFSFFLSSSFTSVCHSGSSTFLALNYFSLYFTCCILLISKHFQSSWLQTGWFPWFRVIGSFFMISCLFLKFSKRQTGAAVGGFVLWPFLRVTCITFTSSQTHKSKQQQRKSISILLIFLFIYFLNTQYIHYHSKVWEINIFIQQRCMKLIKSESKTFYIKNVISFYFSLVSG